jgi:hypothetical protein
MLAAVAIAKTIALNGPFLRFYPKATYPHEEMERAGEERVEHILLINPYGLLPLAKVNRYDR